MKITSISWVEICRKSACFLGQKSIENQLVFWGKYLLKISQFSGAKVYWKSACFLGQNYIENQPIFWSRNILKMSSFSEANIFWKSAPFLEQKSIENQLVFWGRTILKISPFCWANVQLKSALFQWIFTPSENESIFDTVLFLAMKVISFIQLIFLDVNSVYFQQNFVNFLYNKRPNFSWFSSHENKLKSAEFLPLKRSWFQ